MGVNCFVASAKSGESDEMQFKGILRSLVETVVVLMQINGDRPISPTLPLH